MRNRPTVVFALLLLAVLGGCAAVTPPPSPTGGEAPGRAGRPEAPAPGAPGAPDPWAGFFEEYRARARDLEERGRPVQALEAWRVVAAFHPGDAEARERVADLEGRLRSAGDGHFHKGVQFLEGGKVREARRELLLALISYPGHAEALHLLKNGLSPDTRPHTVEEGETLESLASAAYGDPGAAVLIAGLNDLEPGAEPEVGRVLRLPLVEDSLLEAAGSGEVALSAPVKESATVAQAEEAEAYLQEDGPPPPGEEVTLVRDYLEEGSYGKALDSLGSIPPGELSGEELGEIANAAWYGQGRKQQDEKRWRKALESLGEVDPGYRDVENVIAAVEKSMLREAEEHYITGVRFFVDQKLKQAIREWEETLALNPDHAKAAKDLKKARRLMEELERIR